MMNDHGKSDRPVVPEKSPNNAGQPVAEGRRKRSGQGKPATAKRAPDTEPIGIIRFPKGPDPQRIRGLSLLD